MRYDDYRKEKMAALKEKDSFKNKVITNLLSAMTYETKALGRELTEEECLDVVRKALKQSKEALEMSAGRADAEAEIKKEIALLEAYLPAQLSEEALREKLTALFEAEGFERDKKNKGALMKTAMAACAGLADGKRISGFVDQWLNQDQ